MDIRLKKVLNFLQNEKTNFNIYYNRFFYSFYIYNIQIQYIHTKFIRQKLGILTGNLLLFISK